MGWFGGYIPLFLVQHPYGGFNFLQIWGQMCVGFLQVQYAWGNSFTEINPTANGSMKQAFHWSLLKIALKHANVCSPVAKSVKERNHGILHISREMHCCTLYSLRCHLRIDDWKWKYAFFLKLRLLFRFNFPTVGCSEKSDVWFTASNRLRSKEMVETLLAANASVDLSRSDGATALMLASQVRGWWVFPGDVGVRKS